MKNKPNTMKTYKSILLLIALLSVNVINAQEIIRIDNDSTFFTDYRDGEEWAYSTKGNFMIGLNNKSINDDYGKFYQISIYIHNLGSNSYTFDPATIRSELYKSNGDTLQLTVYTNESFQKKIKKTQNWAMALTAFSNGLNSGMAGYQTTYTTQRVGNYTYTTPVTTYNHAAASTAQIAANTQMAVMEQQMKDDRVVREEGYLKKNTIYPDEAIVGFMNIKRKKGDVLKVEIPIDGELFYFIWDVSKKRKEK